LLEQEQLNPSMREDIFIALRHWKKNTTSIQTAMVALPTRRMPMPRPVPPTSLRIHSSFDTNLTRFVPYSEDLFLNLLAAVFDSTIMA